MRDINRQFIALLACLGCAAATVAASRDSAEVPAVWQHRHAAFTYTGFTSRYSCDGLEGNIRSLLLYLGARKDAKVEARGCARGPLTPERSAFVEADFYTLAPQPDANAADIVKAHWNPIAVSPTRPSFMDSGDCELVEQLKELIAKNFSLQDLNYRTDCFPHEASVFGFSVKALALKALSQPASAAENR
jgi:hypothetical protein